MEWLWIANLVLLSIGLVCWQVAEHFGRIWRKLIVEWLQSIGEQLKDHESRLADLERGKVIRTDDWGTE
jgi:hypothetical protein